MLVVAMCRNREKMAHTRKTEGDMASSKKDWIKDETRAMSANAAVPDEAAGR